MKMLVFAIILIYQVVWMNCEREDNIGTNCKHCCPEKQVNSDIYTLVETNGEETKSYNCTDGCIYTLNQTDRRFCFGPGDVNGVAQCRDKHCFGFGDNGGSGSGSESKKAQYDAVWMSTGTVPEKVLTVPDAPLGIKFKDLCLGSINLTVDTNQALESPSLRWDADPDTLYTVIVEDQDIPSGIKFTHWLVTNIPGNNVAAGDTVAAWIPPFDVEHNEAGGLDTTLPQDGGRTHRYVVLVYKQEGLINVPLGRSGCVKDLLATRLYDHEKLKQTYSLEGPIAGNFFRIGHSAFGWTEFYACKFTRCTGKPFPHHTLPGVNDKPQCQSIN